MQETQTDSEFHLVVTGTRRDGRRRYDLESKQALVRACLQSGVSLAGMALKHGVNANLLRKWVVSYQLTSDAVTPTVTTADPVDAFVPVILGSGNADRIAQSRPMPTRPAAAPPTTTLSVPAARLLVQPPNGVTLESNARAGMRH